MYQIELNKQARKDYDFWKNNNHKKYEKINIILKDIMSSPFEGIGKPEALKHELSGYYSRRIDQKNRIVYTVIENEKIVLIISMRYHY